MGPRKASFVIALAALASVALGVWTPRSKAIAHRRHVPALRVDASWPRPLPTDKVSGKPWVTGEVAGTCIDSRDHVFTVNRGFQNNNLVSPETVIAVASPPVIEFDREGNVVNSWGNPAVVPNGLHGCFVDQQDNVWIAGNGDGIVQKYSHDGKTLLLQIGTRGKCDSPNGTCGNFGLEGTSRTLLNEPANVYVDPSSDDIYIADGYGNHRVVVFDRNGTYLRQWGGVVTNNNAPETGRFASGDGGHPHCVVIGNDGLVYVCDRADDRIQVFDKQGKFRRSIDVVPGTGVTPGAKGAPALGTAGSAWDLAFTNDRQQEFFFEADGGNELVHVMDHAQGGILRSLGGPGHQAGQFTFLHSVALDSRGNLFTGETIGGRRVQRFVPVDDDD